MYSLTFSVFKTDTTTSIVKTPKTPQPGVFLTTLLMPFIIPGLEQLFTAGYHKLLVLFLTFICRLWAVGHVSEGLLLPSYLKYDCVTDNRHKNSELNFERSGIFVSSAYIVSDKTSNNKPVWSLVPMGTKDIFVGFQHALHCWHLWKNDVQHTHSGSKYRIWQERLLHHAEQMSRCDGRSLTRQHHSGVAIKSKCFPAACMPLDDRWITSASFR